VITSHKPSVKFDFRSKETPIGQEDNDNKDTEKSVHVSGDDKDKQEDDDSENDKRPPSEKKKKSNKKVKPESNDMETKLLLSSFSDSVLLIIE